MKSKKILMLSAAILVLVAASFAVGQRMSISANVGEESMASFMSEFSALAYLEKGDARNATLVLRDSVERNLLLAHQHGTPRLESSHPGATNRWFSEYAQLRKKLPVASRTTGGDEFDREVDAVLLQAIKDNPKAREK